jgi:glycosyltransferase involved in cell wall biosynthesis
MLMARELGLGGSERQLTEIARRLDRNRFEPHVGCFRSQGLRGEELSGIGVPIVRFPVLSLHKPGALSAAIQMGRYLKGHEVQLVHTFDTPMNLFGVPTARAFRVPIVVSSQRAHRSLVSRNARHLLRVTDQIADAIVVNCETIRRHLLDDENVAPAKIRLCYNGIDVEQFRPSANPKPRVLSDASCVIGVVCALRPEKGLHILLDAFHQVHARHPGTKLLIVGSGPLLADLENRSRDLGVRADCEFEPATNCVADWLHAIDIFVLPSLSEALSNSLMEAMACGCAVVASRVGGNQELVQHGRTGFLFETRNASQLAMVVTDLIEHPELRKNSGAAASQFIHRDFSVAAAAHRMAEIYSELLEGRR